MLLVADLVSLQVLPDGTYVKPKNPRLAYGTMVLVRANIVGFAGHSLAQLAGMGNQRPNCRLSTAANWAQGYPSTTAVTSISITMSS